MSGVLRVSAALIALVAMLAVSAPVMADDPLPQLSHTRLLRRVTLTLLGRSPTQAEYQSIISAANDAARDAIITQVMDDAFNSTDFYEELVKFGYDYFGVRRYGPPFYVNTSAWKAGQAIDLSACPLGSVHEGKVGLFYKYFDKYGADRGDDPQICNENDGPCQANGACDFGFSCDNKSGECLPSSCAKDSDCSAEYLCDQASNTCKVMTHTVEPWWAPGTTIETIGWAGAGTTKISSGSTVLDCGVAEITLYTVYRPGFKDKTITPRCSCGPNLIYCTRRICSSQLNTLSGCEKWHNDPTGQRRGVFDEAARLFAHVIVNDRPFSDIVLGNYTVVNQGLQHMYVRTARTSGRFKYLDNGKWWQNVTDPNAWREVVVENMHPFFLAARDTKHDPTKDNSEPDGIPSAGVLTTIGSLGSFARERPRAARWLENLTCRQFNPPPASVQFNAFDRDPGTEGVCQTCHVVIDPAAIHFKRFSSAGLQLVGFSPWRWNQIKYPSVLLKEKDRWQAQFLHDTMMTPATELDIQLNPDARFIDFAPPGTTLLGVTGDGTIGPLGFAKMIVASGQFDRCTVRRFYERYGGVKLDPAKHKLFIDKMVQVFESKGHKVRPFIRWVLERPVFRMGR